jgi:hypothetical protein
MFLFVSRTWGTLSGLPPAKWRHRHQATAFCSCPSSRPASTRRPQRTMTTAPRWPRWEGEEAVSGVGAGVDPPGDDDHCCHRYHFLWRETWAGGRTPGWTRLKGASSTEKKKKSYCLLSRLDKRVQQHHVRFTKCDEPTYLCFGTCDNCFRIEFRNYCINSEKNYFYITILIIDLTINN